MSYSQAQVEKLLQHVAYGEQDEAEAMLKTQPQLLLQKGTVTDYSNRTFEKITAFQYALWAWDWHMWKMLMCYLPQTNAREQLRELEEKGTSHGKHYDFNDLLTPYQAYCDDAVWWEASDWIAKSLHWNTVIGKAQTRVPAHVAQEYCHPDRSFEPKPTFLEPTLPRTFRLYGNDTWYPLGEMTYGFLGQGFGVLRASCLSTGRAARVLSDSRQETGLRSAVDFTALAELCKVRTEQYEQLKQSLGLQQLVSPFIKQPQVNQLLLYVARGEQDEAEAMLKIQPQLLLQKGTVTDYSNRTFNDITAFQYALWAWDWHMWKMLMCYLPQANAREQLRELEEKSTRHGKQYDFSELLEAYKIYIDNYKSWNYETQLDKHYRTVIGKAQTRVPVHIADECGNNELGPQKTFKEKSFYRSHSNWFPLKKTPWGFLGVDFAFPTHVLHNAYSRFSDRIFYICRDNFSGLTKLREVRTVQYEELKVSLGLSVVSLQIAEQARIAKVAEDERIRQQQIAEQAKIVKAAEDERPRQKQIAEQARIAKVVEDERIRQQQAAEQARIAKAEVEKRARQPFPTSTSYTWGRAEEIERDKRRELERQREKQEAEQREKWRKIAEELELDRKKEADRLRAIAEKNARDQMWEEQWQREKAEKIARDKRLEAEERARQIEELKTRARMGGPGSRSDWEDAQKLEKKGYNESKTCSLM